VDRILSCREAVRNEVVGASIFSALLANGEVYDAAAARAVQPAKRKGRAAHAGRVLAKQSTCVFRPKTRKLDMDPHARLRQRHLRLTERELGIVRDVEPKVAMETLLAHTLVQNAPQKKQPKPHKARVPMRDAGRRKC